VQINKGMDVASRFFIAEQAKLCGAYADEEEG
jgi:hypothetical protein